MKTSGTNRKLRILLTAIKAKTLIPRPEFQRRLVWTNKDKQEFVKTVLMEYPFPEIYIAAGDVDPDTAEGTEMLVDGQQRMTTLYQYFTGSQDLRLGELRPYAKLADAEKRSFLEYEVVVRDLGNKTIEEIKQVFTRINSTKYSLNAMEIHNARYDGAFKKFGEALLENPFFETHRIFTTNDIRRMGDLLFCLTIVCTLLSAYFNRDEEIEDYLEKYNDEFPDTQDVEKRLNIVFQFISLCGFAASSRAWKKADIFTLIIELDRALAIDKLPLDASVVGAKIADFYKKVDSATAGVAQDEGTQKYYKAALQATNDRSSRIVRGQVLSEVIRS
jgi:hypothetical protein